MGLDLPKFEGGFRVLNVRSFNMALMSKWWRNIVHDPQETLRQLLRSK